MTGTSEILQKRDGSTTFWSPIFIFFLGGIPFAALNWWRMEKRQKAVISLAISIVVNLFYAWLRSDNRFPNTATDEIRLSLFISLAVGLIFSTTLALIMDHDIQAFHRAGKKSASISWTVIFFFWIATVVVSAGISFGSDYLARTTRYCRVPRFQDLIYDNHIRNRLGLQTALINRYDFGCNIRWGLENENGHTGGDSRNPGLLSIASYTMVGLKIDFSDSSIWIDQYVSLYQEPITQTMIDSLVYMNNGIDEPTIEIEFDDTHADYYGYRCFLEEEYNNCWVALGYKNILNLFKVSQQGLSESEFEQILSMMISRIDQRIYQLETNSP